MDSSCLVGEGVGVGEVCVVSGRVYIFPFRDLIVGNISLFWVGHKEVTPLVVGNERCWYAGVVG